MLKSIGDINLARNKNGIFLSLLLGAKNYSNRTARLFCFVFFFFFVRDRSFTLGSFGHEQQTPILIFSSFERKPRCCAHTRFMVMTIHTRRVPSRLKINLVGNLKIRKKLWHILIKCQWVYRNRESGAGRLDMCVLRRMAMCAAVRDVVGNRKMEEKRCCCCSISCPVISFFLLSFEVGGCYALCDVLTATTLF